MCFDGGKKRGKYDKHHKKNAMDFYINLYFHKVFIISIL